MRIDYQISEAAAPVRVELPEPEATIPLGQYLDEQMESEHNA